MLAEGTLDGLLDVLGNSLRTTLGTELVDLVGIVEGKGDGRLDELGNKLGTALGMDDTAVLGTLLGVNDGGKQLGVSNSIFAVLSKRCISNVPTSSSDTVSLSLKKKSTVKLP